MKPTPQAPILMREVWRTLLNQQPSTIFSSYIHWPHASQRNEFIYVNDSNAIENVAAVILDLTGCQLDDLPPVQQRLPPGEVLRLDAGSCLQKLGIDRFQGSILLIVHPTETRKDYQPNNKDLVSIWRSAEHACQVGIGGFCNGLNVAGRRERQSYYMFCPAVVSDEGTQTMVVVFNTSSQSDYADTVILRPRLHNLRGDTLEGPEIRIPPFGCSALTTDELFGPEGRKLIEATSNRGSMTVAHRGHVCSSMFFHVDRRTGVILSGRHSQPPANILIRQDYNAWLNLLAPLVPFSWQAYRILRGLKDFPHYLKQLKITFRPNPPLYIPSTLQYLKQSRWILYFRVMLRYFYLLALRRFRFEQIDVTDDSRHNAHVIHHNLWENLTGFIFSRRPEQLIYPLKSILSVKLDGRTLCVGCKNEGEIFLFETHGFTDVTGIDLFSYSPKIQVMDVHNMAFPDDHFDTISCSWMIKYCYDIRRAVAEIVRVAKDGALFACAYTLTPVEADTEAYVGTHLGGGIPELLDYFGPHVGPVYWRHEDTVKGTGKISVIFRIRKPAA